MNVIKSILYTAHARASGGRDGRATSSDGALDVTLATPKGLGGAGGPGTNPEQLFAAGYAACFIGALKYVAGERKARFPAEPVIESSVSIGPIEHGSDLFLRDRTMQLDALPELVEQPRQIGARAAAEARIPARPIDVEAPVGERSHHSGDELGIESLRQGPDEHQ